MMGFPSWIMLPVALAVSPAPVEARLRPLVVLDLELSVMLVNGRKSVVVLLAPKDRETIGDR